MAGIKLTISTELSLQMELSAGINAAVLPLLNQAVNGIAQQTAANWREAVLRAKMWSGEKDAYANSIQYRMKGDFSAEVFSEYKYVEDIETGRPARDLKKMLDTSMKVRRTQDGTRFLVIPFRHNVSSMPAAVQGMAQRLSMSSVNNVGTRDVGQTVKLSPHSGMTPVRGTPYLSNPNDRQHSQTAARLYSWGDKLGKAAMRQAGVPLADRKRFGGMVRMDTSTPEAPRSSFLTFRVMSEKSRGWIVPAQPGQHIAKGVSDEMQPKAALVMQEAIKRSLG